MDLGPKHLLVDEADLLRSQGRNHGGLFKPVKWPKQPGAREWKRADYCSWRATHALEVSKRLLEAGYPKKAKVQRLFAMKNFALARAQRRAALYEGYQPRSKQGKAEARALEKKMEPLERAMMHRRQAQWLKDMKDRGADIPSWVNKEPWSFEEIKLVWDHEHPGKKL